MSIGIGWKFTGKTSIVGFNRQDSPGRFCERFSQEIESLFDEDGFELGVNIIRDQISSFENIEDVSLLKGNDMKRISLKIKSDSLDSFTIVGKVLDFSAKSSIFDVLKYSVGYDCITMNFHYLFLLEMDGRPLLSVWEDPDDVNQSVLVIREAVKQLHLVNRVYALLGRFHLDALKGVRIFDKILEESRSQRDRKNRELYLTGETA